MTNSEAIKVLNARRGEVPTADFNQAIDLAIAALEEKAKKERRYAVVEVNGEFNILDIPSWLYVLNPESPAKTQEAAEEIADIFERMNGNIQ